jgi:disulfide bond formation protein DsbB
LNNKIGKYFLFIILINTFIASSALFIEYILKIKPCVLCLYERYPYYLIIFFCFLFFLNNNWKNRLIILIILTSISSFFLAIYHSGIEYGFINELLSCKVSTSNNFSKDILLKELETRLASSCKEVSFKLFGLSLASINTIVSLILTILYYKIFLWIKNTVK